MTSTMSSAPSAPIVDQFLEFTGSTDRRAAEYLLELGGQDLEAAVSLYLSGERYEPPSAPQLQARKASRDRGAGEGGAVVPQPQPRRQRVKSFIHYAEIQSETCGV